MSLHDILLNSLSFISEDILNYIEIIIIELSINEKQNILILKDILQPFLIDEINENEIENICRSICVFYGGSGYSKSNIIKEQEEQPKLLNNPIKIKEIANIELEIKQSYGGVILNNDLNNNNISNNSLDIKDIPINQRNKRKLKKDNDNLQRKIRIEAAILAEQRQQMAAARMAAIKASRNASRGKAMTGLHIENFSLPHPSGFYYFYIFIYLFLINFIKLILFFVNKFRNW